MTGEVKGKSRLLARGRLLSRRQIDLLGAALASRRDGCPPSFEAAGPDKVVHLHCESEEREKQEVMRGSTLPTEQSNVVFQLVDARPVRQALDDGRWPAARRPPSSARLRAGHLLRAEAGGGEARGRGAGAADDAKGWLVSAGSEAQDSQWSTYKPGGGGRKPIGAPGKPGGGAPGLSQESEEERDRSATF